MIPRIISRQMLFVYEDWSLCEVPVGYHVSIVDLCYLLLQDAKLFAANFDSSRCFQWKE